MSDSERAVEALLGSAARRAEPPADVRARVLAAVEAEWVASRRRRRWPALAAAASIVAAAFSAWLTLSDAGSFELELAQTQSLRIADQQYERGDMYVELRPGSTMIAGSVSRLVSADGTELRLQAGTSLTWSASDRVELVKGALYVDTHGQSGFRVATPVGTVEDIGTRFMVTVAEGGVEVAMREGVTQIDTVHGRVVARTGHASGDVVRVDARGATTRAEPTSGGRWEWIHDAHPGYLEKSVPALLAQIADDLGLRIDFATPDVLAAIGSARMEGDLSRLAPREALRVVLATNGLALVEGPANRMVVGIQTAGE